MGNQTSQLPKRSEEEINLLRLLDSIASKYILTQNFKDLQKLEDKKYCNDLTILTSDVIRDRLTNIEIAYLQQRMKQGIPVDQMTKDEVTFLPTKDLQKLDIQNATKKRRVCIGIARFYIRVAHVFAAIINTINPVYSYKDAFNVVHNVSFMDKMHIPKDMDRKKITMRKTGLCTRRIQSLLVRVLDQVGAKDASGNAMKPTSRALVDSKGSVQATSGSTLFDVTNAVCSLNKDEAGNTKSLIDEPGIPELNKLYYDIFNYNTGKYESMSPSAKKQYQTDLVAFYTAFTGEKTMPSTVTSFGDIPLRAYHNQSACKDANSPLRKPYKSVSITSSIVNAYGERMAEMMKHMNASQNQLIKLLDELFVYRIDPTTQQKEITLHPNLTTEGLEGIVERTRKILLDIYIGCEQDFLKTLEAFEAIIEDQIQKTTERKITNLKKQEENVIAHL